MQIMHTHKMYTLSYYIMIMYYIYIQYWCIPCNFHILLLKVLNPSNPTSVHIIQKRFFLYFMRGTF